MAQGSHDGHNTAVIITKGDYKITFYCGIIRGRPSWKRMLHMVLLLGVYRGHIGLNSPPVTNGLNGLVLPLCPVNVSDSAA